MKHVKSVFINDAWNIIYISWWEITKSQLRPIVTMAFGLERKLPLIRASCERWFNNFSISQHRPQQYELPFRRYAYNNTHSSGDTRTSVAVAVLYLTKMQQHHAASHTSSLFNIIIKKIIIPNYSHFRCRCSSQPIHFIVCHNRHQHYK